MTAKLYKQDIFDKVLYSMRKQGKRSVNKEGVCAYRGDEGAKCAF